MRCLQGSMVASAALVLLSACSAPEVAKPGAEIGRGKFYAVSARETPFYRYGPLQGSGPDQKLAQDTLVTVVRPSFGYSKVKLLSGEQGYLASEDIHLASASLVAAATAPPPPTATSGISKFRLDSDDPRLIAPPPPLPADLPEPTPIPGTETTPVP